MTAHAVILFFDPATMDKSQVSTWLNAVPPARAINFMSSRPDDLAIVSRYRIVTTPTVLILDDAGRVLARLVNIIDTSIINNVIDGLIKGTH